MIEYAELRGWAVYHAAYVKGHLRSSSSVGFPDLVLVRNDRTVFAELKTDKGKLSVAQDGWLNLLRGTANEVYLWRPSDMDEVLKILC